MNPIQNFRGPTSIDSQTLEVQTAEKSNAIAYHNSDKKNTNQSIKSTHLSQPAVQRKLDDSEETLQRKEAGSTNAVVSSSFQSSVDVTKGNGQKMDTNTQGFMASKFGANFSNVSIHNNSRSHQLATQINAKAFTVGNDIYFNQGEYQPATNTGKHLLAHELTHTLQQSNDKIINRSPKDSKGKKTPVIVPKTVCKTEKFGNKFPVVDTGVKSNLSGFGNTSRLAAGFGFGACLVNDEWRFFLNRLTIPIRIDVRDPSFTINNRVWKNIESAESSDINETNINRAIYNLLPIRTNTFQATCSGKAYPQTVANYPRRIGYWSRKITLEHEGFHKKEWITIYKDEIIKAETKITDTIKLPLASAPDSTEAIKQMRKRMTDIMISAYTQAQTKFCPGREIRAYNQDEPKYKALVSALKARKAKNNW